MADYLIADDGKIHTRYSELTRCTPGQVDRVVLERLGKIKRFSNDKMAFGTDRHDMWESTGKATGHIPECFGLNWPISHAEQEFASEILPGIVLHSRPDAICAAVAALVDYKTIIADSVVEGVLLAVKRYSKSKQLPLYAYQLGLHGIRIKVIAYLVEIWNRPEFRDGVMIRDSDTILGYKIIMKDFKLSDVAKALPWVKDRVSYLAAALEASNVLESVSNG